MRQALIILSIVLHKQLVNAIGMKLPGSKWSLPGLGMGITIISRHNYGRKQPDSQTFKRTDRAEFGRWTWSLTVDLVQTSSQVIGSLQ